MHRVCHIFILRALKKAGGGCIIDLYVGVKTYFYFEFRLVKTNIWKGEGYETHEV